MTIRFLRAVAFEFAASGLLVWATWFNYGWQAGAAILGVSFAWTVVALNFWSDAEWLSERIDVLEEQR